MVHCRFCHLWSSVSQVLSTIFEESTFVEKGRYSHSYWVKSPLNSPNDHLSPEKLSCLFPKKKNVKINTLAKMARFSITI